MVAVGIHHRCNAGLDLRHRLLHFSLVSLEQGRPVLVRPQRMGSWLDSSRIALRFYTIYQHLQLHRIRRQLAERDQLFQLISENAADMIALVDSDGRRLYNSPAYQKVLGYSPEDLKNTSSFEQIHPDDRLRVVKALSGHPKPANEGHLKTGQRE